MPEINETKGTVGRVQSGTRAITAMLGDLITALVAR